MNTIAARKDELDRVMKEFEEGRSSHYVTGFYASLVRSLAADQLRTFEETVRTFKMYTNSKK